MNVEPINKPKRLVAFKKFVKKHELAISIIIGATLVAVLFTVNILSVKSNPEYQMVKFKSKEKFYSPLTGIQIDEKSKTTLPVTAVMIENSPESRPQSGLKKAGVVYEAVAEGGVTRFLSLYQNEKPSQIGPVRSLRLYYLNWAAPYQASIAHVGGSPNALDEVRNGHYRDIDEFFNAGAYWRASDRYAPHNVYTSGEKIDQLNNSKDYKESVFSSFARKDMVSSENPNASNIQVNFSGSNYNTSYAYDPKQNNYARSMAGQAHNDREDGQITPKVIVVIKVQTATRTGGDGYEDIVTTGSGEAKIFQNGTVIEGKWSKQDNKAPLVLTDGDNKPLTLGRGQTWIAAITSRGNVSWE